MRWSLGLSLLILVALTILLSGVNSIARSGEIGKNKHTTAVAKQTKTTQYQQQQVPLSVLQSVQTTFLEAVHTIEAKAEAQAKQASPEPEYWYTPSAQKGLLIIGFFYTVFAGCQAWAIRTQIQLQSRPKLIVRNIVHQEPVARGFPISGQFYVANVGDSRATITASLSMVYWSENPLPMRRPYEGRKVNGAAGGIIEAGAAQTGVFASDEVLGVIHSAIFSPEEVAPLVRETALFVMGWIEYRDTRKVSRRTAFCRRFDRGIGRYIAVKDPDYEHAE